MTSEMERRYRDGGYGWVVVMSSFFVGFITDGFTFSFGILLVDMVELFGTDRGKTAIAGALITGVMDAIGPVAGYLCDSYGYRVVAVTGALVSSTGLLASVFVSRLELLYVTYGLLCGTGFGLMYLPAQVCVIHNFDKKRAFANGIAVCGSGVGMFSFNILTRYLLDTYGLRGTFLILSGICLNGVVSGLLLNSPEQVHEVSGHELGDASGSVLRETTPETNNDGHEQMNRGFNPDDDIRVTETTVKTETDGHGQINRSFNFDDDILVSETSVKTETNGHGQINRSFNFDDDILVSETSVKTETDGHGQLNRSFNFDDDILVSETSVKPETDGHGQINCSFNFDDDIRASESLSSQRITAETRIRNDVQTGFEGDVNFAAVYSMSLGTATNDSTTADICPNKIKTFSSNLRKILLAMWDISLLKNVRFLAFLVSSFLLNFAFIIPIHLLPDEAVSLHMSKQQGALLVSAMGISNTVGRVIMGWLGDREVVNRFIVFVCCIVFCGISTGLSPLLTTFEAKMAYACVYGALIGGYVALAFVVLADLVGLDNVSRAVGLVMFAIGVSGALGTPVGGWLFDITGKYDVTFIISGIVFILSSVVVMLPLISRYCNRGKYILES